MTAPGDDAPDVDALERELRRVVDRLATLALPRLAQPAPPWPSRAAAARATAARLVEIAAGLEHQPARDLPPLADRASAHLVAVTGRDVVLAVRARAADPPGSTGVEGDADVARAAADAVRALTALRRAL